ncbi:MAG: lipopolysaccharide heptosyltransferase II [Burkholderiales bacterium]|nr:lipopolysaccharide heptosyltransferase II [Burkholderiales bacterium]
MAGERILIVAPGWIGDAILSEPLVALLRDPFEDPIVDVLVVPWCAPVYARMRGIRRIVESPFAHGRLDVAGRKRFAAGLRSEGYTHAFVLPNSWKSALVPFFARIPKRVGYRGEMRYGLLTDTRPLDKKALPRLVDRFAALAVPRGGLVPMPPSPGLVPDLANRAAAMRALRLKTERPAVILCPGAEYGPAKRWPPNQFAELAAMFLRDGLQVWIIGSPNDRIAADAVLNSMGEHMHKVRDLTGRTDLGTAIDILSAASLVVSNDSGLMHAAAAVGVPLVALFGSSSPAYTPPLSPLAQIAKIDIECSPCFQRECPLGHFKCMRELKPPVVYNLARTAVPAYIPPELRRH